MDPNGPVAAVIDRAGLARDALGGVLADLGDAHDPLQAAIDQAAGPELALRTVKTGHSDDVDGSGRGDAEHVTGPGGRRQVLTS